MGIEAAMVPATEQVATVIVERTVEKGLNGWAIAGIAAGGAALVGLVGYLGYKAFSQDSAVTRLENAVAQSALNLFSEETAAREAVGQKAAVEAINAARAEWDNAHPSSPANPGNLMGMLVALKATQQKG